MGGRKVPRLVVVFTCRKGYLDPFSYDKVAKPIDYSDRKYPDTIVLQKG